MIPRALAGLIQPKPPQVAEEQGGCSHLADGVLKGQPSLSVQVPASAEVCQSIVCVLPAV